MKAKNLGITFGPYDLDIEQIELYSAIQEKVLELEQNKTEAPK